MPEIRYRTHNIYYAAYLVYSGNNCIDVVPSDVKKDFFEFGFDWIEDIKELETAFFSDGSMVEPRAYTKTVAQLRDLLNKRKNAEFLKNPTTYK